MMIRRERQTRSPEVAAVSHPSRMEEGRRVSRFQATTIASLPLSLSLHPPQRRKESGNIPRLFLRPGWRDLKTITVVGRRCTGWKWHGKRSADRRREREREASGRGPRSLTGQYQWTAKLVFAWDYIYSVGSSSVDARRTDRSEWIVEEIACGTRYILMYLDWSSWRGEEKSAELTWVSWVERKCVGYRWGSSNLASLRHSAKIETVDRRNR